MRQSVFERCGGFATVRKIVSDFYDKVMDSPRLQRHFVDVDMRVLIDHQTKFIASVMGGPASFSDDVLRRVHEPLAITRTEFLEVAELLRETLEDHDVAPEDAAHVYKEIMKRELLIVSR
jgi:hemoglobin